MSGRIKFRAYADASCCFWVEVRVFENRRDMCRDIRRCAGAGEPREAHHKRFQTAGQVNGATFYRGGKKTGAFAVMWLNRKDILKTPSEIAAHEATHAALRYFERRGWPVCLHQETRDGAPDVHERRLEERLAYAVGRINKYLTRGLFRCGVWK